MADINNQTGYWNRVASQKTFTHPIDIPLIDTLVSKNTEILDYGCGYGRLTNELFAAGYTQITGVDTSSALIDRGLTLHPGLNLLTIKDAGSLPFKDDSFDVVLLFAVLTCIPSNNAQLELISHLHDKLKPGGILYISDYYLQENSAEMNAYQTIGNDPMNFGVFNLEEGATFRHHSREWITQLLRSFDIVREIKLDVFTMNGHAARAFQIVAKK